MHHKKHYLIFADLKYTHVGTHNFKFFINHVLLSL
jgi:hypothetical protein